MRGESAKLPESAYVGPDPTIPTPTNALIPTVAIPTSKGWSDGAKPTPATGLAVAPYRPEEGNSIKGLARNRMTLLRREIGSDFAAKTIFSRISFTYGWRWLVTIFM